MEPASLSAQGSLRALKLAVCAAVSLYALLLVVAEPLRALGATNDTETAIVSVTVGSGLGLVCGTTDASYNATYASGATLSLPTITFTGDTGTYSATKQVQCKMTTNQNSGYTLSWQILTGTGAAGSRTGTGYLNANGTNRITLIGTGSTNNTFAFPSTATKSGWGGRVSSTSSGSQVGNLDFGTDTSAEKYARVATGSSVAIRQKTSASQEGGDLIRIHFRAYVGSSYIQPTGTYQATVTFTGNIQ